MSGCPIKIMFMYAISGQNKGAWCNSFSISICHNCKVEAIKDLLKLINIHVPENSHKFNSTIGKLLCSCYSTVNFNAKTASPNVLADPFSGHKVMKTEISHGKQIF